MNTKFVILVALVLVCAIAESKRTLPCRSCVMKDGLLVCSLNCVKKHKPIDEAFTTNSDVFIHDAASCTSCIRVKTGESICTKRCNNKKQPKVFLSDGCRKCVTDSKTKQVRCTGKPCKSPKCNKATCTRKNHVFSCKVAPSCNSTATATTTKQLADDSADEYSTLSTCNYCYFSYVHGEREISCVDEPCAADYADSVADIADSKNNSTIQPAVSIRYENCTSCWKENVNGNLILRCQKDYNNKECHIKNKSEAALSIVTPSNSVSLHNLTSTCKKCTISMVNGKTPSVSCVDMKKQCKAAKNVHKQVKQSSIHIRSGKDSKCWTAEVNGIISIFCKRALKK